MRAWLQGGVSLLVSQQLQRKGTYPFEPQNLKLLGSSRRSASQKVAFSSSFSPSSSL